MELCRQPDLYLGRPVLGFGRPDCERKATKSLSLCSLITAALRNAYRF